MAEFKRALALPGIIGRQLPGNAFATRKDAESCNSFGSHAIEAGVRLYGAEHIVCGTDGTEFGVEWTRKALDEAQVGDDAREKKS